MGLKIAVVIRACAQVLAIEIRVAPHVHWLVDADALLLAKVESVRRIIHAWLVWTAVALNRKQNVFALSHAAVVESIRVVRPGKTVNIRVLFPDTARTAVGIFLAAFQALSFLLLHAFGLLMAVVRFRITPDVAAQRGIDAVGVIGATPLLHVGHALMLHT